LIEKFVLDVDPDHVCAQNHVKVIDSVKPEASIVICNLVLFWREVELIDRIGFRGLDLDKNFLAFFIEGKDVVAEPMPLM